MDGDFSHTLRPDGTGPCPGCGQDVQFFLVWGKRMPECEPCQAAERERKRINRRREDALAAWLDVTPTEFRRRIEPYMLAPELRPALDLDGATGVGFAGASGGGKTRVAFALLRKAAARGLTPYAVTAAEFRQAVANRHHNDPSVRGEAVATIRNAHQCQALLLDDIGKSARNETADEAFSDLLDNRHKSHRLTFWTMNGSSEWLKGRLGLDHGPAIIRRMVDLTRPHSGGKPQVFVCDDKPEDDK
jgi:DNA replication protein DnaC